MVDLYRINPIKSNGYKINNKINNMYLFDFIVFFVAVCRRLGFSP